MFLFLFSFSYVYCFYLILLFCICSALSFVSCIAYVCSPVLRGNTRKVSINQSIRSFLKLQITMECIISCMYSNFGQNGPPTTELVVLEHLKYPYGLIIMKTSPCNEYPLTPHFCIVNPGFTGVYIFFLFVLQNIDCEAVLTCTHNQCFEQK